MARGRAASPTNQHAISLYSVTRRRHVACPSALSPYLLSQASCSQQPRRPTPPPSSGRVLDCITCAGTCRCHTVTPDVNHDILFEKKTLPLKSSRFSTEPFHQLTASVTKLSTSRGRQQDARSRAKDDMAVGLAGDVKKRRPQENLMDVS